MKSLDVKLVLIGSQGVGKTSIAVRYMSNMFSSEHRTTIGASFFTCTINSDDYRLKVQIWDTAGQERFRSMAPMFYRDANAAFLMYDITSAFSFTSMKIWANELFKVVDNDDLVVCVVGNKLDSVSQRETTIEKAEEYASSINAHYFETSAKTNQGITDLFMQMATSSIQCQEARMTRSRLCNVTVNLEEETKKKRVCCS